VHWVYGDSSVDRGKPVGLIFAPPATKAPVLPEGAIAMGNHPRVGAIFLLVLRKLVVFGLTPGAVTE
jgi:hypothetical protein